MLRVFAESTGDSDCGRFPVKFRFPGRAARAAAAQRPAGSATFMGSERGI